MSGDPTIVVRSRRLPLSFRLDRRVPGVALVIMLITLGVLIAHVGYGEYPIAPLDVIKTVLRLPTDNADYSFVVNTLRLPRALVAWLVGSALAVSGALLQGLTRNALADPGIVGVSSGAGLAAVTLIVIFPNVSAAYLPFAAFGGACVTALLIYLLAWRNGHTPLRLILVGIGLGAITGAATTIMITFGEINQVSQALVWLTGSVYARGWNEFRALLPWVGVGFLVALVSARNLNALNLGEDMARSLGSAVERQRGLLLLISVALAAAAVAAAGAIGFVGLIAPHIARRLVGATHEGVVPIAAMLGGLIVSLADLVGRTLFAPTEIPCGIITAIIGAPYFLYLLFQRRYP